LKNGTVLVTGGENDNEILNSAELYDPLTQSWTRIQPMKHLRMSHKASLLFNGKVLVTGGATNDYDATKSTELYNPITQVWEDEDDMRMYRVWHTASTLTNGNSLIVAGSEIPSLGGTLDTAELYNSTAKIFTSSNSQ
jgi:N-acetylneuraminic acid mutarotase